MNLDTLPAKTSADGSTLYLFGEIHPENTIDLMRRFITKDLENHLRSQGRRGLGSLTVKMLLDLLLGVVSMDNNKTIKEALRKDIGRVVENGIAAHTELVHTYEDIRRSVVKTANDAFFSTYAQIAADCVRHVFEEEKNLIDQLRPIHIYHEGTSAINKLRPTLTYAQHLGIDVTLLDRWNINYRTIDLLGRQLEERQIEQQQRKRESRWVQRIKRTQTGNTLLIAGIRHTENTFGLLDRLQENNHQYAVIDNPVAMNLYARFEQAVDLWNKSD